MRIRPARPDEAPALAALQERASVAAFAHIFPPERYPYPREAVLERWRAALADADAEALVVEGADAACGVALVRPGWLEGLYVEPEAWGTGVAAAVHDAALERVRASAPTTCSLWVLEENVRARRFYERRGWRENGQTRVVAFPPNPLDVGYTIEL